MQMKVRVLGLDAHADTVAVAVAKPDGEVRSLEVIPNRAEPVRKLIRKLSPAKQLRACCEPGPTGYLLYWQLTEPGVECAAVAPSLVPGKAGDRVKADRRDVARLARCHRAGDLTAVGGCRGRSRRWPGRRICACTSAMPSWPPRQGPAQDHHRRRPRLVGRRIAR